MKNAISTFIVSVLLFFSLNLSAHAESEMPGSMRVNLRSARGFNQQDTDKLNLAIRMVELIVNSKEFKNRVLNFSYNGKQEFVQNEGMSNQQVYDYLMKGAEKWPVQTAEDKLIDMELQLYTPKWWQSKSVIGYTSQDVLTVFINRLIYRKAPVFRVAMNLVHEWTHKMGFGHDFRETPRRPYTVPYGVGYIVRDIGAEWSGVPALLNEDKASDTSQNHD
jgi:hypothetical protein